MSSRVCFSVYNFNIGRKFMDRSVVGPNYWVMVLGVDEAYE